MSEDEIGCPFCDKANGCRHLVASFDHENAEIGGGVFFDREAEVSGVLLEEIEALFAACGESVIWESGSAFEDVWNDFLCRREDDTEEPLDSGVVAHLLDVLLQHTEAISEGDDNVVAFYDPKPSAIYEKVIKAIRRACIAARENK